MEKKLRLVFLMVSVMIVASNIFIHNSQAAEFSVNSPSQLKGYSYESGILFNATKPRL